jgi:hypothetical protein
VEEEEEEEEEEKEVTGCEDVGRGCVLCGMAKVGALRHVMLAELALQAGLLHQVCQDCHMPWGRGGVVNGVGSGRVQCRMRVMQASGIALVHDHAAAKR